MPPSADLSPPASAFPKDPVTRRWFHIPKPLDSPALRLFCFPYAGGSGSIFHRWTGQLPPQVELRALQLPGRSFRMRDTPFTRMGDLIDTLEQLIAPQLDRPFALFGHSMGAAVAFELACRLRERGLPQPKMLLVSARQAPQFRRTDPPIHTLPDPLLLAEMRRRYGAPEELVQHAELMALMLPAIRADFTLLETYEAADELPLELPIVAFGGTRDGGVPVARLEAWAIQTTGTFETHLLEDGHFFIQSAHDALVKLVAAALVRGLPTVLAP